MKAVLPLNLTSNNKHKSGWSVQLRFQIGLHEKDKALLEEIQSYFCFRSPTDT